jgi:hypothetical protein
MMRGEVLGRALTQLLACFDVIEQARRAGRERVGIVIRDQRTRVDDWQRSGGALHGDDRHLS